MYFNLNKEERKIIRDKYKNSNKGANRLALYRRVMVDGVTCLSCALAILFFIFRNIVSKNFFILVVILTIASLVFLIAPHILRINEYNKFIANNKK